MMNTFYGPAPFEAVLKAAAIGKEQQANRAERVRKERSDELQRIAKTIDDNMDRRRHRKENQEKWKAHHDLIVRLTAEGVGPSEIAAELLNLGFCVQRKDVSTYQFNHGLRDRENNPFNRCKQ